MLRVEQHCSAQWFSRAAHRSSERAKLRNSESKDPDSDPGLLSLELKGVQESFDLHTGNTLSSGSLTAAVWDTGQRRPERGSEAGSRQQPPWTRAAPHVTDGPRAQRTQAALSDLESRTPLMTRSLGMSCPSSRPQSPLTVSRLRLQNNFSLPELQCFISDSQLTRDAALHLRLGDRAVLLARWPCRGGLLLAPSPSPARRLLSRPQLCLPSLAATEARWTKPCLPFLSFFLPPRSAGVELDAKLVRNH